MKNSYKSIVIDRTYFFQNIRYKWKTTAGKEIYVDELDKDHLRNIFKLFADPKRYFPHTYLGYTRYQWKDVIYLEIQRRAMSCKPKKPYESLEELETKRRQAKKMRDILRRDDYSW